ncbi:hypothetical protein TNCV_3511601 [Trichonephila clavipes]|nr:hypothetical protein TNCV_3511601 [Trichonephila clavipes]
MYYPQTVREDSLPDSNLVLPNNERGVSDFLSTLYKQGGFFQTWTAYSSLLNIIMFDDVERTCFTVDDLTVERFVIRDSLIRTRYRVVIRRVENMQSCA